ncbi:MAG: D-alanyl-D-alanine carboxypeptidase/D-alanyl-D-alanine-endopeptidase [Bacteroidota bacterium]
MKHLASKTFVVLLVFASVALAQKDTLLTKKNNSGISTLSELRDQLDDYFNDPNFNDAFIGVVIKSQKTGEVLYKRNADKLFIPASNMKLFTSSAALILLGSDYQYETNLFVNGKIKKGVLQGDLIVQGSGDPSISGRFYDGNVTKVFENWADTLKSKGIWVIDGNIFGDDSLFDNVGLGKGWELDYESEWFAAPSGALSFNDNSLEIKVEPTEPNFPANVILTPDTKYVTLAAKVVTVEGEPEVPISVSRLRGTNLISITGEIKKGAQPFVDRISVSDPTMYFLTVMKEVFEKKGIVVKGKVGPIESSDKPIDYDDLTPILDHRSLSLKMLIKELNKNSNNFYAEQILKTIGSEIYNYGSIDEGVKACKEIFSSMGINTDNMVMADGSGLSRLDLVTPRQIVNLLSYMAKSEVFDEFYDSLPIAGVDGTLIDRMKKSSAENNVHAKAGYNNNVSSLSGYLTTVSGERLIFSIIINNFLAPPALANYIMDSVCNRLVNFSRN